MSTKILFSLVLFKFVVHVHTFALCSTFQDCQYEGCAQSALEGHFFGCNCKLNEVQNTFESTMDTHCYNGDEDQPIQPSHCVYSNNYGISFEHCPCRSSCPIGQFIENCNCKTCPEDHTCDGHSPPCATTCAAGQYLDECQCKACPPNSFCLNLTYTSCDSCEDGFFELSPCTAISNRKCSKCNECPYNFFRVQSCTATRATECKECQYCKQGFYAEEKCTQTTDTKCSKCLEHHWCPGNQNMYEPIAPGSNVYKDIVTDVNTTL
jgi:hypothetical protein